MYLEVSTQLPDWICFKCASPGPWHLSQSIPLGISLYLCIAPPKTAEQLAEEAAAKAEAEKEAAKEAAKAKKGEPVVEVEPPAEENLAEVIESEEE